MAATIPAPRAWDNRGTPLKFRLILLTGALVLLTAPPAGAATFGSFKTPSHNVICDYSYGAPDSPDFVVCAIKTGIKPQPHRVKCTEGDFTDHLAVIQATGPASEPRCAGDPGPLVSEKSARVLRYGKSWHHRGLRCTSRRTGLTCRNRSGHGFVLSRAHSRLF